MQEKLPQETNLTLAHINHLSANPTKCSNTFKQFVGKLPTNCLSVFDHFVGLVLKVLKKKHKYSDNEKVLHSNTGKS